MDSDEWSEIMSGMSKAMEQAAGIAPISPLYLPYISLYISPISPLYLP